MRDKPSLSNAKPSLRAINHLYRTQTLVLRDKPCVSNANPTIVCGMPKSQKNRATRYYSCKLGLRKNLSFSTVNYIVGFTTVKLSLSTFCGASEAERHLL